MKTVIGLLVVVFCFFAAATARALNDGGVSPSLAGRYHLTILPEDTKFDYQLSFNNPNRFPKNFTVNLVNGEVVQKVAASMVYEDTQDGIVFQVPTGESVIHISGRLTNSEFKPLTNEGLSYLLIDTHPLLTLDVYSPARRISVGETGMASEFSGSRGFLLDGSDNLVWKSKKLEVLPTLSYTVSRGQYEYYWTKEGRNFVEAQFSIANMGSAEIPLKIPGTATYAEINGVPQTLFKDDQDRLLLRVPNGSENHVLVQYKAGKSAKRAVASLSDELARPDAMMSNVEVNVQIPYDYKLLYGRGVGDSAGNVSINEVVWALLVACFAGFMLRMLDFSRPSAFGLAFFTGFFVYSFDLYVFVFVSAAVFLVVYYRKLFAAAAMNLVGVFGIIVVLGILAAIATPNFQKFQEKSSVSYYPRSQQIAPEAQSPAVYQGVSSKIEMPREGYNVRLHSGLMDNDVDLKIQVLSIPRYWVSLLDWSMLAAFAGLIWRNRRKFLPLLVQRPGELNAEDAVV